jgi:hypothetical protein
MTSCWKEKTVLRKLLLFTGWQWSSAFASSWKMRNIYEWFRLQMNMLINILDSDEICYSSLTWKKIVCQPKEGIQDWCYEHEWLHCFCCSCSKLTFPLFCKTTSLHRLIAAAISQTSPMPLKITMEQRFSTSWEQECARIQSHMGPVDSWTHREPFHYG